MVKETLLKGIGLLVLVLSVLVLSLFLVYKPLRSGELHLSHAKGEAMILREAPKGIHHIKADNLNSAVYA